jgi:hypothetical protein
MALYKLVSLEPCDCCNATHEVATLSDIQAYLSEHGLVAISAELPREIAESFVKEGYQLREIVKLYSLMIAAQGEVS